MNNTLTIRGMHCAACKSLIEMELEENGYEKNIVSLELLADDKGALTITDANEKQIEGIVSVINSMDGYEVV